MPEFDYRAADGSGRVQSGQVTASSREAALRQLQARGLTPIALDVEVGGGGDRAVGRAALDSDFSSKPRRPVRGAPGQKDVHHFTSELAVMLRAGLSLDRALRVLIDMADKPTFLLVLEGLLRDVKSGKGFSQALSAHQTLFGDFYINMVRSGEIGGQLPEVLSRLAEHLERAQALRESVVSALIYPAILVVVAGISVFLMLGFVVPQFETLFDDMGEALPLPTRVVVAMGNFVAEWLWVIVLIAIFSVWVLRRWFASSAGKSWRDKRLLGIPVLGEIVRKYEVARFARSMGTLLGNGVPIVTSLNIATVTMSNKLLRDAMGSVSPSIKQGGRLADGLRTAGLFTPLGLNMVRMGEETGRLDQMLLELARVHDGEVQSGIKRALTLIEPALILILGFAIAAIIVSILMGIMSVNELAI